ncbi:MAG: alpha/beta fold hydrolase [Cyanobacteria bacterium P01_G01_bin.38]
MSPTNPWVVFPRPDPDASMRLFCFSHAGAGASTFRPWGAHASPGIEICAVQYPGRETRLRESPFRDIGALVADMHSALLPYLDRQFICFGHSVGALICFEWVRYLRRQGCPLPVRLFVSGRQAPQVPLPLPWIHTLPDSGLKAELRSYGGTPEVVLQSNEFMAIYLPILRADLAINETYAYLPDEPIAAPISIFGGLQDHRVSFNSLEAWDKQTTKGSKLRLLPGGHLFIRDSSKAILQAIAEDIVTVATY